MVSTNTNLIIGDIVRVYPVDIKYPVICRGIVRKKPDYNRNSWLIEDTYDGNALYYILTPCIIKKIKKEENRNGM